MDDNLSLFRANRQFFGLKEDRKFIEKYPLFYNWLSLFDKYRNYLKEICVNCKCDQNINHKLFEKIIELENECNNLFIENQTKPRKPRKETSSPKQDQLNDSRVKRIKLNDSQDNDSDRQNQSKIGDQCSDIGLIDAYITGVKHSLMNNSANHNEVVETVGNSSLFSESDSRNNEVEFIDLTGDDLRDDNDDYVAEITSESQIINAHIIGIETEDKPMSNCFISSLVSKKLGSFNRIIGYRCKWPQCYFIETDSALVAQHLKTMHHILKQFMCRFCNKFFEDDRQLMEHEESAHHKQSSENAQNNQTTRKPRETSRRDSITSIESKTQSAIKRSELLKYHTIDTDTEDVVLMNQPLVTMLLSKKSDSMNRVVGYRCKFPRCDYVSQYLMTVYKHLNSGHNKYRPTYEFVETVKNEITGESRGYRCKWQKCDFFERRFGSVCEHINLRHIQNPLLICKVCGLPCQGIEVLIAHSKQHDRTSHAFHDEKCAKKNCSIGKCRFKLAGNKRSATNSYFDFSKPI